MEAVKHNWHLVDAKDQILGHVAVKIATKLMGKEKPTYTPHTDDGDFVVVLNAASVASTGRKTMRKAYYRYSGFPSGLKVETLGGMLQRKPEEVIRRAVQNMLPKNRLQSERMARLKIYAGAEHPHTAELQSEGK